MWPHLVLNEKEIMLCFSEDQSGCFHAYEIPCCWRGFFVLERKVPWQALGIERSGETRVRVRTCPMGWIQAVDLIQEAHRRLLTLPQPQGAGLDWKKFVRMGAPVPEPSETAPRDWYSVYVDNFDQGKIVLATERHIYEHAPSGEQLAV